MWLVVAHHLVVNSGVMELSNPAAIDSGHALFLHLFGAWGKMAINCFVLISGYFMCTSNLTGRRYLKLFLEYAFYSWTVWIALVFMNYETFTLSGVKDRLFAMFVNVNTEFMASFLWFYLGIPIYNIVIGALDKRGLYLLIAGLVVMFTASSSMFRNDAAFNHVFWYMTMYFIGSSIRLYPFNWMNRRSVPIILLTTLLLFEFALAFAGYLSHQLDLPLPPLRPILLSQSDRVFALLISVSMFLVFRNIDIPCNRAINTIASTCFGVLLIHGASDGMRNLLWVDVLSIQKSYHWGLPSFIAYSVFSVSAVFSVCSVIDMLRIKIAEKPLFARFFGGTYGVKIT